MVQTLREANMPKMPLWKTPKNIAKALEDGDGFWEDERWSPILVTAMSGTESNGREIPVTSQIEFDPSDDQFGAANAELEDKGVDPDGYRWGEQVRKTIRKTNPGLAKRLHLTDSKQDSCAIWVEIDSDCRALLETIWGLTFNRKPNRIGAQRRLKRREAIAAAPTCRIRWGGPV
jgi:hypothetical protein